MTAVRRFLSAQWPVAASALLHGGVLTLLLWHVNTPPIVVPEGGEIPLVVDLVMAETPAATPPAPSEIDQPVTRVEIPAVDTAPAPAVEVAESPPPVTVEDPSLPAIEEPPSPTIVAEPPPPIESSVADVVVAPPPPPPEVKPAPEPPPLVTRRTVPPPKPAAPAPPQTAARAPAEEERPALMLPRPGAMLAPEPSVASPILPPIPVGPPVDYVGLVRAQLEKFKQYPRAAQQRRLQGAVMVSIVIDSSGRVLHFRLIKGSGHEILDREVTDLVKRASPLPPIPARYKTDRLEIVVPIEFLLQG